MRLALSARAYRRITFGAVLALSFITISGAAVRLTGSGLGCSDWPTCEEDQFVAALDSPHAMVEFVNRLVTGAVSIAIIAAVLGALIRVPRRRDLLWWSLGLVVGMVAQIVLGGMVVLLELAPVSVIGHFMLSMVLLWNALVLHDRASTAAGPAAVVAPPAVRRLTGALLGWGLLVLATVTVVTGAGPHGGDSRADRLPIAIPDAARIHGVAVIILLVLAVTTIALLVRQGTTPRLDRRARWLVGAIVVQGAIGYTQYFTGVPALLVELHIAGAVIVWAAVVQLRLATVARPDEVHERDADDPAAVDGAHRPTPTSVG